MGPKLEDAAPRRLEMRAGVGKTREAYGGGPEAAAERPKGARSSRKAGWGGAWEGCVLAWQGLRVCEEVSQHAKMSSRLAVRGL